LGIPLLPTSSAVFVAFKNKMDLAIGVAVGSSIQIALFAIPFTVGGKTVQALAGLRTQPKVLGFRIITTCQSHLKYMLHSTMSTVQYSYPFAAQVLAGWVMGTTFTPAMAANPM